MKYRRALSFAAGAALFLSAAGALAQSIEDVPARNMGEGPYERLILRGANMIDGSGAPMIGPVDIVVEQGRIAKVRVVGYPGVAIDDAARPERGDREIDLSGKYILPGFVDLHGHIHSADDGQGVPSDYVLKLWMAHGVTTVREVGNNESIDWLMDLKRRSARNEVLAPRLYPFIWFGAGDEDGINSPREAREWVRMIKRKGADGIKFYSAPAEILWAALDEAGKQNLKTTMHHAQLAVTHANVLDTSAHGLNSMEHWYGLPEAMFTDRRIQDYPVDYNYQNEQHRFGEAGRLWAQAAKPGSETWNATQQTLLQRDFALVPTFTIYMASRDWMRARRAEWHDAYTMPSLWDFFRPSRKAHGSYWFDWGTEQEVAWRENFRLWMDFVNEYKNRGGQVGVGSDAGYIYSTYGFGYVQELELLREAGFHPLEVIRSATLTGAEILGAAEDIGSIQVGKRADFVVVDENPLANLKVLYATGHIKLDDETGAPRRVGGVRYAIKDGIVYDAKQMAADVRAMTAAQKAERGIAPGPMPIVTDQQ